jgi:hypothetical protein
VRKWQKKFWSIVSVIVVLTMLVAAVSSAATVTSANDFPSTLETSAAADHELVFTTPSGAAEGETIIVSFDADFETSSITEDDVDVEDDGADLTTAADCSGAEQASVAMAADTLTVTICAGDGGAIAATSEVTIRLGTNATSSGVGANQIVNPASAGTYFLNIAGSFGDSGSIALPMLDEGSVTVSASVPSAGGGGGAVGGAGGCLDSTAPVISTIVVSSITLSSASVSWSTDESADSKVDYGETSSYEIGTETDTSLVRSHSIALSGLSEGTEYHFRIRSSDSCANQASSSDQTFSTSDETAPVITNVVVTVNSTTSVTITWTTNEPATSVVDYGETTAYGSTSSDTTLTTEHSVTLTGLSEGTTYHYTVSSSDASGNEAESADNTFTTLEDEAPGNVSDVVVEEGDGTLVLSWTNPTDDDFAGVRILLCTDGFPSGPDDPDCEIVYDGTGETAEISGLTNDVPYYVGIFSYDEAGQFASGALASGTPSAPEEEVLPPEEEAPPAVMPSEEEEVPSEEVPAGEAPAAEVEAPAEIPPTTVSEGELVPEEDVQFFVANWRIELMPTGSGVVHMLGNRPLRVMLSSEHVSKEVDRVQLVLGESAYLMALAADGSAYIADVSSPGSSGSYAIAVSIYYADGNTQTISYTALVEDDGYVYATTDGETSRVGGATVELLEDGTVSWDGSPFGQFNPLTTGSDGSFGWYVPNTTYALSAEASGYAPAQTGKFSVDDNIANRIIQLAAAPVEEEEVVPPTTLIEQAQALYSTVTETVGNALAAINETLEAIRVIPGVEETAAVSTPALAVTTAVATTILVTTFDLVPFLQYFFSSPFMFFWRRKRRAYGVVYNAISKVPLDLATVRLFRMPDDWQGEAGVTGRLIQSRVTDKGGRYFFLPTPGRYKLTAFKSGFIFPSVYLAEVKDDGEFLDVYHGEPIEVTDRNATIAANIPMDPSEAKEFHEPKRLIRLKRLRRAQKIVAILGIVLSLVAAIIRPTLFSVAMVVVQTVLYLLVHRLAAPKKPKSWGIVYDRQTGRPLERVIARVFEPKYNKLLETTVTDSKGRYTFLLGPNEYYTVYEKGGFEPAEVRPIDYRDKKEASEFSQDVKLSPEGSAKSSQEPSEMTEPPRTT